jgi:CRP-like cAMP-binding protein
MSFEESYLFVGLSEGLIKELEEALVEEEYEEGSLIFQQGEAAKDLFVLESGRVRMTFGGQGPVSMTIRNSGEVFGWSSVVLNDTYFSTAESLSKTRLRRVSGKRLQEIFESYPSDGLDFYRRLARVIRRRLIDSYKSLLTYDSERTPYSYG